MEAIQVKIVENESVMEVNSSDSQVMEKLVTVERIEESDTASPEDISVDLLHQILFDVKLKTISNKASTATTVDQNKEKQEMEGEENGKGTNGFYAFTSLPHFAFTFSKTLLDAWVKQPSPCCAASSVAGALNALFKFPRNHPNAWDHLQVLSYYEKLMQDRIDKQRKSLERLIGHDLSPLISTVSASLESKELPLGGYTKITKSKLLQLIRECISKEKEAEIPSAMKELYTIWMEGEDITSSSIERDNNGSNTTITADVPTTGEAEDDDMTEELNSLDISSGTGSDLKEDLKKRLYQFFHDLDGLAKLRRPKPSTAIIGNWAIIQVIERIIEDLSSKECDQIHQIQAGLFMGKGLKSSKLPCRLTCKDDEATKHLHWQHLWQSFTDKKTAFIFHLKNHYALIFGLREWQEKKQGDTEIKVYRELLTARRGQRPSVWMSWEEARETLLSWNGYKMIRIQLD